MKNILFCLSILILFSCKQSDKSQNKIAVTGDQHSYAKPELAVVKHLELSIKVDFKTKTISGVANWEIENPGKTNEIILDANGLKIEKVVLDDTENTTFKLGKAKEFMGQPLSIRIKPDTKTISIWYQNSPSAAAVQWLSPQQTAGKKLPFMFTQSEAILARTWIPCQDSPGIRFSYNATVTVPRELIAVMSAENPTEKNSLGIYTFTQTHAIPSYLMALAVGDIAFKAVDERTGVYAEPETLPKAAYELADMGKMVTAAEKIYGPYRWKRYDVLILPPSFPFGGMENPMLTFATPTIIAGDHSLVSLIAHELAHSWSGNLVTNATWNDFWLNEGFTTYFERRIVEAVYGKSEADMQEVLGRQDLMGTADEMGKSNPDTRLKTDFTNRDPDLGVSDIAYEKGYAFLKVIENAVGHDQFDTFLRSYFDAHAFRSMTTEGFLDYLNKNLIKGDDDLAAKINVDAWVYKPGIPDNIVPAHADNFDKIDTLLVQWKSGNTSPLLSKKYSTNEMLYMLRHLPDSISADKLKTLDKQFNLTASGNAEIQTVWYVLAVQHHYTQAYPAMENFLVHVGRRKFLLPLYKKLIKTPEGKKEAKKIYVQARPNYHSVAYNTIDELLK